MVKVRLKVLRFVPSRPLSGVVTICNKSLLTCLSTATRRTDLRDLVNDLSLQSGDPLRLRGRSPIPITRSIVSGCIHDYNVKSNNYVNELVVCSVTKCYIFACIVKVKSHRLSGLLLAGSKHVFRISFTCLCKQSPGPFPPPVGLYGRVIRTVNKPSNHLFLHCG